MIDAKIILDSYNPIHATRLTTMELTMHRFILAEFNTHRKFSRNSASSRAIPIAKRIKEVLDNPAIPMSWGQNQKGMQASKEIDNPDKAKEIWLAARDRAVEQVGQLVQLNVHKQVANRLLEPFLWHKVIVSSTEWANFYNQRCSPQDGSPPLAQPEMYMLADKMLAVYKQSTPTTLEIGEFHLPYLQSEEKTHPQRQLISVARCARVSYLNHDGKCDPVDDIALAERLSKSQHASPFEHVAKCTAVYTNSIKTSDLWMQRNFDAGWHQLRAIYQMD